MGSLLNRIAKNKSGEKDKTSDYSKESDINNIQTKPFFKEKNILATDYKYYEYTFVIEANKLSIYDIYKLKDINDSFYLAFLTFQNKKDIKILKYNFINKTTEKVTINLPSFTIFPTKIKYFYDQIQNKENLFILLGRKIRIFLIKNDSQYEEETNGIIIKTYNQIHDFEIIYDKYKKINYLIISKFFKLDSIKQKRISIYKFIENEIVIINEYKTRWWGFNSKRQKFLLIWENKVAQNFYLITSHYTKLKFMEISDKANENIYDFNIISSDNCSYNEFDYFGCIIYNVNNTDYLYICNDFDALIIIDLYKKEIISKISFIKDITSIINWNQKYIIISTLKYIYTFDTKINKIINKYLINTNGEIISIKKINVVKNCPFSLSVDTTDGKIIII